MGVVVDDTYTGTYNCVEVLEMSQLTIYLSPNLLEQVQKAAHTHGISQSKWVTAIIEEKLADEWPEHIKALAGSWGDDFPEAEELRKYIPDIPRESF